MEDVAGKDVGALVEKREVAHVNRGKIAHVNHTMNETNFDAQESSSSDEFEGFA